jgi:hypothetical protein
MAERSSPGLRKQRGDMMDMSEKTAISETRKFGIALTIVLAALATVQALRSHPTAAWWLGGGSALALAGTILAPRTLVPVRKALTIVARAIGWVNTRILLAVTFYLVFAPVGLVARLLRKDLLKLRFRSSQDSYWIPCEPKAFNKEDYTRQF